VLVEHGGSDGTGSGAPSDSRLDRTSVQRIRERLSGNLLTIAAAFAITIVGWPIPDQRIFGGLDPSWQAGLHMAFADHIQFGPDLAFTHGPLGFLVAPRLFATTSWALSVAVSFLAAFALAYVLVRLLRTRLREPWAALVALPFVVILNQSLLTGLQPLLSQVFLILSMLWAFRVVIDDKRAFTPQQALAAGLASSVVLVKADAGLSCLAILGYAVVYCAYRTGGARFAAKMLALFLATATAALLVLWMAIGQSVANLGVWLSRTLQLVEGHSAAMNVEAAPKFEYTAAIATLVVLTVAVAASKLDRATRIAVLILSVACSYLAFRQGFVRHDIHSIQFFAVLTVIPFAFIAVWGVRQTLLVALLPTLMLVVIGNLSVTQLTDIGGRLDEADQVAHLAVSSSARDAFMADSRAELRAQYALPPDVVRKLSGHTVDIEPSELMIAWAYPDFRWRQLPVFQTYDAYTQPLDQANAEFLAGRTHPDYVLRQPGQSIDGRLQQFESPEATLELLCNYRTIFADDRWQVLHRTPDRCGEPRTIGRVKAHLGETVRVPPGDDAIVVARFKGAAGSFADKLRTMAFAAPELYITGAATGKARFLQGTQDAPHVLKVPGCGVPSTSPRILTSPFPSLELSGPSSAAKGYEIEFQRIAFRC